MSKYSRRTLGDFTYNLWRYEFESTFVNPLYVAIFGGKRYIAKSKSRCWEIFAEKKFKESERERRKIDKWKKEISIYRG